VHGVPHLKIHAYPHVFSSHFHLYSSRTNFKLQISCVCDSYGMTTIGGLNSQVSCAQEPYRRWALIRKKLSFVERLQIVAILFTTPNARTRT